MIDLSKISFVKHYGHKFVLLGQEPQKQIVVLTSSIKNHSVGKIIILSQFSWENEKKNRPKTNVNTICYETTQNVETTNFKKLELIKNTFNIISHKFYFNHHKN